MYSFGDRLYGLVSDAKVRLFTQGEMAQLAYASYEKYINFLREEGEEVIPITYPIGYKADSTPVNSTSDYTKNQLIERYNYLALTKLPIDGIFQLVTVVETLLSDLLRNTLIEYPAKIPNKRKIDVQIALEATSLDGIKISIVNNILNELTYRSPKDYAEDFRKYVGVNLLEQPSYHKYIELKATRDIHIHNSGIANEVYLAKAATLSRVRNGEHLPVNI